MFARASLLLCLLSMSGACSVDHPLLGRNEDTGLDTSDSQDAGPDGEIVPDAGPDTPIDAEPRDTRLAPDMFMCVAPRQVCGADCIDLTANDRHCGECNNVCEAFAECKEGRCTGLPLQIPNLQLWLDASHPRETAGLPAPGPLALWHDRSAAAHNVVAVGELPLLGEEAGRAFVRFDDQRFEVADGVLGDDNEHIEIFVVVRNNEMRDGSILEISGEDRFEVQFARTDHSIRLDVPIRTELLWGRDTRHVTLWHVSSGLDAVSLRANGQPVHREAGRPLFDASGAFTVGSRNNGSHDASFDLMELLVYERALSNGEHDRLTAYLMAHWSLTGALPSAGLIRHYDATNPSGDGVLPSSGGTLALASDLSTSDDDATCTNVEWRENGLSIGHPSFHLETSSRMELTNPHSETVTISVVFRTPTERGDTQWWRCPTLMGGDGFMGDNDGGLVLDDGHMRWRDVKQIHQRGDDSYSDNRPHHVILTRHPTSDDVVEIRVWVDGVPVLEGQEPINDLGLPEHWWVGAHEDTDGSLAGDFAEIHVYDRVLSDEELNQLEAHMQRKWDLVPIGDRRP